MADPDAALAQQILNTLSCSFQLSLGEVQITRPDGSRVWRLTAANAMGERWAAEAETYYGAVCELAALCGMELEE